MNNCGEYKLNLGSGRILKKGYINIDIIQFIDNNGKELVDKVIDIEKVGLPFCDNSCTHILADSVLEHIINLEFVLNECHRVLKKDGILEGVVPTAGSNGFWRDPTHKRFFVVETFEYFTGESLVDKNYPRKPKYARYGFKAWNKIEVNRPDNNGSIYFKLTPRK